MAYDPAIYSNIPEPEHTSLKADFGRYASQLRQWHALKEPFLMYDLLQVLHEIIRDKKNADLLDPLEEEAARLDYIERQNHENGQKIYSSKYQQAIKLWRRAIFEIAKEKGYQ